ncbi:hypothetical protein MSHI_09050 [Mycobacterium shinjukuense]|uniref:Uncharacterized protein n=1 Tax=Mycobacterium shinjukuense TaxID=398694 RepID=A0A7I7MNX4_9MYCO|nr:hypothetical protein MSHI_09050 [Mycobacterium shinjukuense]
MGDVPEIAVIAPSWHAPQVFDSARGDEEMAIAGLKLRDYIDGFDNTDSVTM